MDATKRETSSIRDENIKNYDTVDTSTSSGSNTSMNEESFQIIEKRLVRKLDLRFEL